MPRQKEWIKWMVIDEFYLIYNTVMRKKQERRVCFWCGSKPMRGGTGCTGQALDHGHINMLV